MGEFLLWMATGMLAMLIVFGGAYRDPKLIAATFAVGLCFGAVGKLATAEDSDD